MAKMKPQGVRPMPRPNPFADNDADDMLPPAKRPALPPMGSAMGPSFPGLATGRGMAKSNPKPAPPMPKKRPALPMPPPMPGKLPMKPPAIVIGIGGAPKGPPLPKGKPMGGKGGVRKTGRGR